ncbi:zinc-ribbon domain-containing protein [Butyrivibrio sp. AE2032]|uniref:zinc-ribbon domain-containing protein n=1 Tax=Butyrivibrio sp. AE2032 TaxID=1458463 RepID=UPI000550FD5B|nr:zinc ribbon domain-containing protein [Butyrivibrio sp. AE2032]
MKCEKCGADNPAGSKFCTSCGAPFPEEVKAEPVSNENSIVETYSNKIEYYMSIGSKRWGILFPIGLTVATILLFTILLIPWKIGAAINSHKHKDSKADIIKLAENDFESDLENDCELILKEYIGDDYDVEIRS